MDNSPQTSFIPKRPISPSPISYENRGISIVTIICVILFLASMASAVGSYLYRGVLEKQLDLKKSSLQKVKDGFDLPTIEKLKRLDTRMQVAQNLINSHVALTAYFALLEDVTLKSIRFTQLTISADKNEDVPSGDQNLTTGASSASGIKFVLKGTARNYSGVALQSDRFSREKGFREPIFSDLSLDDKGNVQFSANAVVSADTINYRNTLGSLGVVKVPVVATSSASTSTKGFGNTN